MGEGGGGGGGGGGADGMFNIMFFYCEHLPARYTSCQTCSTFWTCFRSCHRSTESEVPLPLVYLLQFPLVGEEWLGPHTPVEQKR